MIDLDTSAVADPSVFSLDSVLREISIYSIDIAKVKVYNLELQATNSMNSQIDSSLFTITILNPCVYIVVSPSSISSPLTYYLYDVNTTIVLDF